MRTFALFLLACSTPALAAPLTHEGEFVHAHKVLYKYGYDRESCREEKGEWIENTGCAAQAEDSVQVIRNGQSLFARVNTTSSNASLCDFSGEARRVADNVLVASAEGEEFVPGQTSNSGRWVPATCEIRIQYQADGSVTVKELSPRKCASFCGDTGFLSITRAVRK